MGSSHYRNFVEINLVEDKEGPGLFGNIRSTKDLYYTVQAVAGKPLGDYRDTLIFLDGIQEYRRLMPLLKFLRAEHRYRFIVSGINVGAQLKKTVSIPVGSISTKRMYPLDIEEFFWANGIQRELIDDVRTMVRNREPIPDGLHKRLMDIFKDYLICGGLPYCVDMFLRNRDVVQVRDAQADIYRMYRDSAWKYDLVYRMHTGAVLDSILPGIENGRKRVFVKDIEGRDHARFSDYRDDIEALVDSGAVMQVTCCGNPAFPLRESEKRNLLKLYMLDVGILTGLLYGYNARPLREDIPRTDLGNVYERVAAMQLSANGHTLYYSDSKKTGEVDFLVDDHNDLSIKALEIGSGKGCRRRNAIDKLMGIGDDGCRGVVLSNSGKIETDGRVVYLPIYSIMFI